jgi:NAD+ synthase (glutamine-hydrolysing)
LEKNGNVSQSDEEDMGMSYVELSQFGTLRKVNRNGPFSMFNSLLGIWKHVSAKEIGEKVKRFFRFYAINRHKMTVLTPAVHAESYSNDDNRYDLRPFVYPINFDVQFKSIDDKVKQMADK